MAEVLGVLSAVQAATQLLEQALRVFGRLRKAHDRQKTLVAVLAQHENELKSVKAIIGIIDDEESLQTATVATELIRLRDVQSKLAELLEELDPKPRGSVQQFTRQLIQGSSDEGKLSRVMKELAQVKSMLLLRIQVANVGVMHNMEKRLVANTEIIERIDHFLREEIGGCEGLKIARLLKGRRPSNDGTVPLTPADLRSLRAAAANDVESEDETLVDDSDSSTGSTSKRHVSTERIILRNMAKGQAMQINAPIGKDIWKNINRIVIKDNVAQDAAIQINHTNTLEVTRALLMLNNEMKITARQAVAIHKLRDSVLSPP